MPVMALFMLALLVSPAAADEAAVLRGEAVVEQWCRDCHQRPGEAHDPDMAPTYEEIVRRPGRDAAWFTRFLHEDHFPMPLYRLFEHEKRDVVAWLMSLKGK